MKTRAIKPAPVSHTIQHKSKAANQAPLSKILQSYKDRSALNATVQREAMEEDDELLQGKFETAQREGMDLDDEEEPLQGKFDTAQCEALPEEDEEPLQQKAENKTGLPDELKAGVEAASGFSMDDVRVYYNSSKPAQLRALAYAQGTDIHIGPGQEKHLPHEAWHVVQQKQGRVKPTVQMQGVQVNDDEGLEKEADMESLKLYKQSKYSDIVVQQKQKNVNQYSYSPVQMLSKAQRKQISKYSLTPDFIKKHVMNNASRANQREIYNSRNSGQNHVTTSTVIRASKEAIEAKAIKICQEGDYTQVAAAKHHLYGTQIHVRLTDFEQGSINRGKFQGYGIKPFVIIGVWNKNQVNGNHYDARGVLPANDEELNAE